MNTKIYDVFYANGVEMKSVKIFNSLEEAKKFIEEETKGEEEIADNTTDEEFASSRVFHFEVYETTAEKRESEYYMHECPVYNSKCFYTRF